jgi:LmbE family N-acetylglucosaminyl deacetylase
MRALQLAAPGERLAVLCLGAHSDDIEIGAGATLLSMMDRGVRLEVHWCVLSGAGEREQEAKSSAADFLSSAANAKIEVMSFRDGFFPPSLNQQPPPRYPAVLVANKPTLLHQHEPYGK